MRSSTLTMVRHAQEGGYAVPAFNIIDDLSLRAVIEAAANQVIHHTGRALGAGPYCKDEHFARLMADLPVYLRQSHAERDLAALGKKVAIQSGGTWQL